MLTSKKTLYIIGLFIFGIIVGIAGTLFVQYLKAPKQTVNVVGQGVIEALADQAVVNVTITNTSWSQQQANDDNKQEVQKLKDNLIALGIAESRITQSGDSILLSPNLPFQTVPPPPSINGGLPSPILYKSATNNPSASASLTITLDTITGIDKVFATINNSPNAKISNTSYFLKSSSAYDSQAREKALQDARNQVESIAKINNLHVGKLLSINNGYNPVPMYKGETVINGQPTSDSNNSVSYGGKTIPITATYNVLYELY